MSLHCHSMNTDGTRVGKTQKKTACKNIDMGTDEEQSQLKTNTFSPRTRTQTWTFKDKIPLFNLYKIVSSRKKECSRITAVNKQAR